MKQLYQICNTVASIKYVHWNRSRSAGPNPCRERCNYRCDIGTFPLVRTRRDGCAGFPRGWNYLGQKTVYLEPKNAYLEPKNVLSGA